MNPSSKELAALRKDRAVVRFWTQVSKSAECWLWTGLSHRKHGMMHFRGKMDQAHRISWQLENGDIPPGAWVLHRCGNGLCVRPDHLYLGDHKSNTADAVRRGEMARGSKNGWAKIKESDLPAIFERRAAGELLGSIGASMGVSYNAVREVLAGITWGHATGHLRAAMRQSRGAK